LIKSAAILISKVGIHDEKNRSRNEIQRRKLYAFYFFSQVVDLGARRTRWCGHTCLGRPVFLVGHFGEVITMTKLVLPLAQDVIQGIKQPGSL
jgi:hypothetical protein